MSAFAKANVHLRLASRFLLARRTTRSSDCCTRSSRILSAVQDGLHPRQQQPHFLTRTLATTSTTTSSTKAAVAAAADHLFHNNNNGNNSGHVTEDFFNERIDPARRESAHRLLDVEKAYPVGSFTPETWFEGEELLTFWPDQRTVESVDLSFRVFDRMLMEGESARSSVMPTDWRGVDLLNRMVNNWRVVHWEHDMDGYTPDDMLQRIAEYATEHDVTVNEKTFYLVAEGGMRRGGGGGGGDPRTSPDFVEKVLNQSMTLMKEKDLADCLPSTDFWTLAIRAWEKSQRHEAPVKSEALVERMLEFKVPLRRETYVHLISAWANSRNRPEGAMRAEELFRRMLHEYQQGDKRVKPDEGIFQCLMIAWSKSGNKKAGQRADDLVEIMINFQSDGHLPQTAELVPALNAAMQCHSATKTRAAARKAQDIFEKYMQGLNRPDFVSFLVLIQAWAQVGGITEVEKLIQRMTELARKGRDELRPNCQIMTAAISACAKSRARDKVERAENILIQMNQQADPALRPTTATYNAFLDCLVRTKQNWPATKAERILNEMKVRAEAGDSVVRPNGITYSTVVNAWARFGHAQQATAVLRRMYDDYLEGNEDVKPNLQVFNTVLASFIKSNRPDDSTQAENLLRKMKELSEEGLIDVMPDVYSYSSVIACYANTKHERAKAAEQAYRLLNEMRNSGDERIRPNLVCYNAAINAWARARNPEKAAALLKEMYRDYAAGNKQAKPDVTTFNTLLKAWAYSARANSADKAMAIIDRMNELHASGALEVAPNVTSYTTVILCYGLNRVPGGPARADEILEKMDELHRQGRLDAPSEVTLKTLKRAWVTSQEPNRDVRVKEIDEDMQERFGRRNRAAA